jgi:hypothetical protein
VLFGFNRGIDAVDEAYILEHYEFYGCGPKPPPIDHQGISDAYGEKPSTTLYWYEGEWLHLAGAD